jgi:acetyl esterase/lipase
MRIRIARILLPAVIAVGPVAAAEVRTDLPPQINVSSKYVFYLHGISVELHGPDSYNQRFRKKYQNAAIARALSERGFTVIAEARPKETLVPDYSDKVTSQVRQLLAAGVPPRHIAVVGHSKGGFITLAVAAKVASPEVSYALLATCPLPQTHNIAGGDPRAFFEGFVMRNKGRMLGRVLSLYDVADDWMGTCGEILSDSVGLTAKEVVLKSGLRAGMGHSLFYEPNKVWIDPVVHWIAE